MKLIKSLFFIGLVSIVVSFSTCYFGVKYAKQQIPSELRNKMSDTDWIGVEWIGLGSVILLIAILALILSMILWLRKKVLRSKEKRF